MPGRTARVNFVEDEDIYIDCKPVSTYGGEVITTDDDNNILDSGTSADTINKLAVGGLTEITKNIGFQLVIGITTLAALYGIGNYVFKQIPRSAIDKKLTN